MTDLQDRPLSWTGDHPAIPLLRAALARAEAAEADTADAEDLLEETESELSRFMDNLIAVVGDEVQFSAIVEAVTALRTRAEAAEARTEELAAAGRSIIKSLRKQIAELEAAAAWHPATEKPPAPGRYSILLGWNLYLDAADYDGIGWGVVWPRYWRERGPLPAAADTHDVEPDTGEYK